MSYNTTSLSITWNNASNTSSISSQSEPLFLTIIKGTFMGIIILGAILGNMLVIVSVLKVRRLRRLTNTFIASLAFADLLVAMFVMPFNMSSYILNGEWVFNSKLMCDIFNASDVMFSTASLLHLCCISMDRYIAVLDPLRYQSRMTRKRVAIMLVLVWIASALLSHVPIHTGWYTTDSNLEFLRTHTNSCRFCVHPIYSIVSSGISFWIPLFIMVFAYFKILVAATKQEKQMRKALGMGSRASGPAGGTPTFRRDVRNSCKDMHTESLLAADSHQDIRDSATDRGTRSSFRSQQRRLHREHKAAKTLGIVMGAFVLCWLPFFIWYLCDTWLELCESSESNPSQIAGGVLFWIGYLNSCLNPMIYAYFNRDFRTAFKHVLRISRKHGNGFGANYYADSEAIYHKEHYGLTEKNGNHAEKV